jgi:hypothetical protein
LSTDKHALEALLTREVEDVVDGAMRRSEGVTRLGFATTEQRLERWNVLLASDPSRFCPSPLRRQEHVWTWVYLGTGPYPPKRRGAAMALRGQPWQALDAVRVPCAAALGAK